MLQENFEKLSDEEIVQMAKQEIEGATDYLMEKYKNLVRKKARSLYLMGGDKDDLIQEGMIGLYKAVRSFDREKNDTFYPFAELCISRQLYSAIKASNRQKNIPLNSYISLYAPVESASNQGKEQFLLDTGVCDVEANPEAILLQKERMENLENEFSKHLSKMEKEVLHLYLAGMAYTEIAEKMNKTPKSIDNALQRIRMKVAKG